MWEGMEVTPSGPVEANRGQGPRPCSREGARGDDRQTDDLSIIVRRELGNWLKCRRYVMIAENGSSAQSGDVSGDGSSLGSGRHVRVVHLRPMMKHPSMDNILSYTDL